MPFHIVGRPARELCVAAIQEVGFQNEVEALLLRETSAHRNEQGGRPFFKAAESLQCRLAPRFANEICATVPRGERRISRRIPNVGIDTVGHSG